MYVNAFHVVQNSASLARPPAGPFVVMYFMYYSITQPIFDRLQTCVYMWKSQLPYEFMDRVTK